MRTPTILAALALAANTLAFPSSLEKRANPSAIIKNKCPFSIWATSIGADPRPTKEVYAGGTWAEDEYLDRRSDGSQVGTSIQITRSSDALWSNKAILVFAYTYHPESIYFDLGHVNGFDLSGATIHLYAAKDSSKSIVWPGHELPQETKAFLNGTTDLVLELCA